MPALSSPLPLRPQARFCATAFACSILLLPLLGALAADSDKDTSSGASPVSSTPAAPDLRALLQEGGYDAVISHTENLTAQSPQAQRALRASAFQNRGIERFFAGDIDESILDFDAFIELFPAEDPHHWQRGLAYYYAERYEEGVAQFERHQTVNSQDVENAVWHFLCKMRLPGATEVQARKDFIDIQADGRVPMKEVHALFSGTGTAEAVLEAASEPMDNPLRLRNHLCYAHLYLGLYFEALGDTAKSAEHLRFAASDYRMDHYMGRVAQLHARLRKVLPEDAPTEPTP